jgi:hypothetical protein
MIGFNEPYTFTLFGTTGNYSAIANLHTFQFTFTHALGFSVFTSRVPATDLLQSRCNFKSHMKSSYHSLIPFLPFVQLPIPRLLSTTVLYFVYSSSTIVRVRVTLRLAVYRKSVRLGGKLLETHDHEFFQLNTCGRSPYITSSLTRGWVYPLQLLLVLASAVILRSVSRGIYDHILRSPIWDLPNMEGQVPVFMSSRNRVAQLYPQALGYWPTTVLPNTSYNHFARTPRKTPSYIAQNACLLVRYLAIDVLLLSACVAGMCLPTCCVAMGIHVTLYYDKVDMYFSIFVSLIDCSVLFKCK